MQNVIKTFVLFLFFTSGVSGLIYEVVWIRMFGLVLGNTTYAISITIGAFFAGLALGGFYFGRLVDRVSVGSWQLAVGNKQKTNNTVGANMRVSHIAGTTPNGDAAFKSVKVKEKRKIIRIYAYLELGIAVSALFVGTGILYMQNMLIWVNQHIGYSSTIINLMRFVFSFSLLLIPTVLMGATLPVLSKFLIRQYHEVRSGVALLYGLNTFGATLGCLVTGFYLIQTFGVSKTVFTGVIINSVIGIVILILERLGFFDIIENGKQLAVGSWQLAKDKKHKAVGKRMKSGNRKEMGTDSTQDQVCGMKENNQIHDNSLQRSIIIIVFLLFGLSGFTSIAYEIIWARMLSSLFLNSIYSFTTMLATFLGGLAIGAIIVMRLSKRQKDPLVLLGIVEFCIGISAILLIILFNRLPGISSSILSSITSESPITWNVNVYIEFGLSFMVMIVPCILMGMTLPLASQVVTKEIKLLGQSVGNIYSINTLGGIFGAIIVGCLLIPVIGVKFSELSLAGLNICIGITFLFFSSKYQQVETVRGLSLKRIIIPLFCLFAVAIGVFCSFTDIRMWETDGELLYYNEDSSATVSVVKEKDGNKKLIVNKKYTLGTSKATPLQKRMGYIPLLLHRDPRDVLVIGMGTGITLSAVASYASTETVNCIEVISSVADAAERYFAKENNLIHQNKKTNLIVEDGRNHLLLNKRKYDVIISDLFVPYHAGAGSLYTKEHFELCKKRIYDTGLFCQWLPLYQMSTKELKVICKTFSAVFPSTTLWFCNYEKGLICGLVGTKQKLKITPSSLNKKMANANTRDQLKKAMVGGIEELLSLFITDEIGLASFTKGQRVNSDNYPIIEFLAPKNIYEFWRKAEDRMQRTRGISQKINGSRAAQTDSRPGSHPDLHVIPVKAEERHIGLSNLLAVAGLRKEALPLLTYNNGTLVGGKSENRALNEIEREEDNIGRQFDTRNMGYYSDATGYLITGILYYYNDMLSKAEDEYLTAWELAPGHLYLRKMFLDLSVRFYRMDNLDETIFINEKLVNAKPEIIDPFLYFYLGLAYQAKGQVDRAISSYHNAIALNPPNKASIHYNLSIIYKSLGLMEKAISESEKADRLTIDD